MPIARPRPKGESGGNSIVSGMVSLATHIDDPVKRLDTVRGSSQHAKELIREMPSTAALSVYLAVTGVPFIVAQTFGQVEKVHPQNLVISNVPGPREKRYVDGALLDERFAGGEVEQLIGDERRVVFEEQDVRCVDVAVERHPGHVGLVVVGAAVPHDLRVRLPLRPPVEAEQELLVDVAEVLLFVADAVSDDDDRSEILTV